MVTADGTKQFVKGLNDLPVNVNNHIQVNSALAVLMLPQSFTFGSDFWRNFEHIIDFNNSSCHIQSKMFGNHLSLMDNFLFFLLK